MTAQTIIYMNSIAWCSFDIIYPCSTLPIYIDGPKFEQSLFKQAGKLTLSPAWNLEYHRPKQFSIHKYLRESRPVTILLQSLPQSTIILFVKHTNALIIHPLVFENANNSLQKSAQWGTSQALNKGHNFVLFHQPVNEEQWHCQLHIRTGWVLGRRSGFFFLGGGFQTHVALPDSFPGGTFPVAFMCSSIHDFPASLEPPYLVHLLPQPTVQYHHC